MDYREELQKALERAGGGPSASDGESLESYWNICCGCVLAAEQDEEERRNPGGDASLVRTFLVYATWLEGYDHMLDRLYMAASRMCDAVSAPILRLQLLKLYRQVLLRMEARCGHDLNGADEVEQEIFLLERQLSWEPR